MYIYTVQVSTKIFFHCAILRTGGNIYVASGKTCATGGKIYATGGKNYAAGSRLQLICW